MKESGKRKNAMTQREAISLLAQAAHAQNALIISEIGSQSVWLLASGDHPSHLYLSGPMGMASSVALGVAIANPKTPILAICGDGSLAMNLGSIATISSEKPPNLTLAVMDNGTYEYTGNLPSPSLGISWTLAGETFNGLNSVLTFDANTQILLRAVGGPKLIVCYVALDSQRPPRLPFDGSTIHKRFKNYCSGLDK